MQCERTVSYFNQAKRMPANRYVVLSLEYNTVHDLQSIYYSADDGISLIITEITSAEYFPRDDWTWNPLGVRADSRNSSKVQPVVCAQLDSGRPSGIVESRHPPLIDPAVETFPCLPIAGHRVVRGRNQHHCSGGFPRMDDQGDGGGGDRVTSHGRGPQVSTRWNVPIHVCHEMFGGCHRDGLRCCKTRGTITSMVFHSDCRFFWLQARLTAGTFDCWSIWLHIHVCLQTLLTAYTFDCSQFWLHTLLTAGSLFSLQTFWLQVHLNAGTLNCRYFQLQVVLNAHTFYCTLFL